VFSSELMSIGISEYASRTETIVYIAPDFVYTL